jgi:copper chaperone CopZ
MSFPWSGFAISSQTVALKVSIHCEGCKKKVKKVLQSIEGG